MVTFCTFVNIFNKFLHSDVNSNEPLIKNSPIGNNNELNKYQLLMEYLIYLILSLVLVLFLSLSLSKHFSFTSGSKLIVLCIVIQVLPVFNLNMNTVTHGNVPEYLPNSKNLHLSQLYIDNFQSLQCSPWYINNFKHLNFSQFYIHNFESLLFSPLTIDHFESLHFSPLYIYNLKSLHSNQLYVDDFKSSHFSALHKHNFTSLHFSPLYIDNLKSLHSSQLYIDNFKSFQFSPLLIHNFRSLHFSAFYKHNFKSLHYSPFYIDNINNEYFSNRDQNAYITYEKLFSNSILNRSNMLFVAKMRSKPPYRLVSRAVSNRRVKPKRIVVGRIGHVPASAGVLGFVCMVVKRLWRRSVWPGRAWLGATGPAIPRVLILLLLLISGDTGCLINPGPINVCNVCQSNIGFADRYSICIECGGCFHKGCILDNNTDNFMCNLCVNSMFPFSSLDDTGFEDEIVDDPYYNSNIEINNIINPSQMPDNAYECFRRRGLHFIHVNARSLFYKMSEIRKLVQKIKSSNNF